MIRVGSVALYLNRAAARYGWFSRTRQEYWLRVHVGLLGLLIYPWGSANLRDRQTVTRARFNDVAGRWIPDEVADAMEEELFAEPKARRPQHHRRPPISAAPSTRKDRTCDLSLCYAMPKANPFPPRSSR